MFLAVIGKPFTYLSTYFNGLVAIVEVAEKHEAKRASSNSNFCYDADEHTHLKDTWRSFCTVDMTLTQIRKAIDDNFTLNVEKVKLELVARKPKSGVLYYLTNTTVGNSPFKTLDLYELVVKVKAKEVSKKVSGQNLPIRLYFKFVSHSFTLVSVTLGLHLRRKVHGAGIRV